MFLEQMGDEFVEAATPGEELVGGAGGLAAVHLDAQVAKLFDDAAIDGY